MSALIPALVTLGVGVGLYMMRDKIQVGDEVQIPASAVSANAGLATLASLLMPTNTGVGFRVTDVSSAETVRGTPVALFAGPARTPIPGVGEFDLPRSSITALYRNGKAISL